MIEDLAERVAGVDLLGLIEKDTRLKRVARTNGGEWAGPCPLCPGGDDRFRVWPDHPLGRGRFWCRRCERSGDAIDYVMARDGIGFLEALQVLGIDGGPVATSQSGKRRTRARSRPKVVDVDPPGEQWQERARAFVAYAAERLWSEAGAGALAYLFAERGLTEETIRGYGLGYNPRVVYDRDVERWGLTTGRAVYLSPGIVIPCSIERVLWYVQVRRPHVESDGSKDALAEYLGYTVKFAPGVKYWSTKGSVAQALYGADGLRGAEVVLFCEGEFDAMLAYQEAGDLVDVATIGGASKANQGLPGRWLLRLLPYRAILAAYDQDGAGRDGAAMLARHSRRVRGVTVPEGGDLTGFWLGGGDLRGWVMSQLEGLEVVESNEA